VPALAREALMLLVDELAGIWRRIEAIEARLVALHRADQVSRPGVDPRHRTDHGDGDRQYRT